MINVRDIPTQRSVNALPAMPAAQRHAQAAAGLLVRHQASRLADRVERAYPGPLDGPPAGHNALAAPSQAATAIVPGTDARKACA